MPQLIPSISPSGLSQTERIERRKIAERRFLRTFLLILAILLFLLGIIASYLTIYQMAGCDRPSLPQMRRRLR